MKTKHVFAATFILGLFWTGYTFANAGGPPGEVNGVTGPTCYQANCHNTGPSVNFGGVLISIGGLPVNWTPGTTYNLSVTISRAAARYGFQFSAVSNATNAQAGTLLTAVSPADTRVSIVPFNGRQYAQHNNFANTTGVFNFRWVAPELGAGAVRFNVAGNAANGDFNNTGDFIYTTSVVVSPSAGDGTPPVITSVVSGGVNHNSATITWTTDEDSDSTVEYGTNTFYGITAADGTLTKEHSILLTNLPQATTFHFRVKSKDASGNVATGTDAAFITTYSITNLSGVARISDGLGSLAIGYAKITPNAGSTTPSGVGIFGYRPADVLVTEAGVPDSPLITSGRTYAEVSANTQENTGVAMANPNATDVTVNFEVRSTAGTLIRSGSFILTGTANTSCVPTVVQICNQMARFLNEAPFLSGTGIQGTLSFTSTQPISVIALRGFFNERQPPEFLITTLPVLDLSLPVATGTRVIPHFVAGESWTTKVLLVNPTGSVQTGTIQVLDASGAAQNVRIDSTVGNSAAYSVAANSSQRFVITGAGPTGVASGPIRVVPTGGGPVPTPLVIFSLKGSGSVTVSETGVPVIQGSSFRMYGELDPGQNIRTGIAIANATSTAGTVLLSVTSLDGLPLGSTPAPLNLPASGQIVSFIDELIPSLAGQDIQAVLRVTTTVPTVSVVALRLRINERGDSLMTTTPPTIESDPPGIAVRVFPHSINGDGFTTQFILISGTAGQTPAGSLSFTKQSGEPLIFNVK